MKQTILRERQEISVMNDIKKLRNKSDQTPVNEIVEWIKSFKFAEGLRNLYLHLQGRSRLELAWEIYIQTLTRNHKAAAEAGSTSISAALQEQKNAWRSGNPFKALSGKKASLLIIGDHVWGKAQIRLLSRIPADPIQIKDWEIQIGVYATRQGATSGSKPYALLPLNRLT